MPVVRSTSSLSRIEAEFIQLTAESRRPLAINGWELGSEFPDRSIPLDELRTLLLKRSTSSAAKDAAWSYVVQRTQDGDNRQDWTIGATGLMLPALRSIAGRASRGTHGCCADIDSETVLGFLEALRTVDPHSVRITSTLWSAASRRAWTCRRLNNGAEERTACQELIQLRGCCQPRSGHPDLVLFGAVADGVLTPGEADLIGDTRVENQPLIEISTNLGLSYDACRQRRSRAERRLVRHLGHPHEPLSQQLSAAA